jgi:nicotinate phosphoribosyltransferase
VTVPTTPLLTDLYQLTMAQGYWRTGLSDREVSFDYFFRSNPFGGGYTVTAGQEELLRFLEGFRFSAQDMVYLESLGIFEEGYLDHLEGLTFEGEVRAMAEGTVAFPGEPVIRMQGRLEQCQLVESTVLNLMNFQSLVATKACRVCLEAGDDNVMEFGLRRAQGPDGSLTASRAAFIGGCASTSNLQAGRAYRIPVRGTHAHSWVLAFDDELAAFRKFAEIYGDSTVLLVDTYDTLSSGVPNAIEVAREMERAGHRLAGIRLDSGELARLSIEARKMLDAAGLEHVKIVCSGDLDEWRIRRLKQDGARIDIWGVGTNLVTADGEPALNGVYKLAALRGVEGQWSGRAKLTDEVLKATLPGRKQVWRLAGADGEHVADWIEMEGEEPDTKSGVLGFHLEGEARMDLIKGAEEAIALLHLVMRGGEMLDMPPALVDVRSRVKQQAARLPEEVRRLDEPRTGAVLVGPRLLEETRSLRSGKA